MSCPAHLDAERHMAGCACPECACGHIIPPPAEACTDIGADPTPSSATTLPAWASFGARWPRTTSLLGAAAVLALYALAAQLDAPPHIGPGSTTPADLLADPATLPPHFAQAPEVDSSGGGIPAVLLAEVRP